MSHVKFNSNVKQSPATQKVIDEKIEKFSDAVTTILKTEAVAKLKKLVYVFITVDQIAATSFRYQLDDSRDKISETAKQSIKGKFETYFSEQ